MSYTIGGTPPGTYARSGHGIYVPPAWGTYAWKAKLAAAKAGTGLARVAFVGDSLTQGWFASNFETASYAGRTRVALQALGGDGGSGYKSVADTTVIHTDEGDYASVASTQGALGNLIATTGTWAADRTLPEGPAATIIRSDDSAATATYTVRGTLVEVFYLTTLTTAGATLGGTIGISVDGGAAVTINTSTPNAKGVAVWQSGTLTAGTHTVTITTPDATALGAGSEKHVWLNGVSGRNATGVVCDRYAHAGYTAGLFNNASGTIAASGRTYGGANRGTYGKAGLWSGGSLRPADLLVWALGVNDINAGVTADTYINQMNTWLQSIRGGVYGAGDYYQDTDLVLLVHHLGKNDTNKIGLDYMNRITGMAKAHNAAVVNMWEWGRNSWKWHQTQGYWGVNTTTGAAGSDGIHLSDAGHQVTADLLLSVLTA